MNFIFEQETYLEFANVDRIKEKVVEVLRQIHGEKREEEVMVDMWCHFGHAYITKIDEGESLERFYKNTFRKPHLGTWGFKNLKFSILMTKNMTTC